MGVSIDHVTPESGSVQWVRGSHKWGRRFDPIGSGDQERRKDFGERGWDVEAGPPLDGLEPMPDIGGHLEDYDIVSFETQPGDVLISNLLLCHGAPGNASDNRRRSIGVRFAGEKATYAERRNVSFSIRPAEDPELSDGDPFPADPSHHIFPQLWPRLGRP